MDSTVSTYISQLSNGEADLTQAQRFYDDVLVMINATPILVTTDTVTPDNGLITLPTNTVSLLSAFYNNYQLGELSIREANWLFPNWRYSTGDVYNYTRESYSALQFQLVPIPSPAATIVTDGGSSVTLPTTATALVGSVNWNTQVYYSAGTLTFSEPAPSNATVTWASATGTQSVAEGATQVTTTASFDVDLGLIACPNWNTAIWMSDYNDDSTITLSFSGTAPSDAQVAWIIGDGFVTPDNGASSVTLSDVLSADIAGVTCLPTWQTDVYYDLSGDNPVLKFSTDAPQAGETVYYSLSYNTQLILTEVPSGDLPQWLQMPVALMVLYYEYRRESPHQRIELAQACYLVAQLLLKSIVS